MCQLLGMTANVPTDICFSFAGLAQRGGRTGPHKDGWGVAFYGERGLQVVREPVASCDSARARFFQEHPLRSRVVLAHVRQANVGEVAIANTHPFTRRFAGRTWSFAHNGQLAGLSLEPSAPYRPLGRTDSETAFCILLNRIRQEQPEARDLAQALPSLVRVCQTLSRQGVFNILVSDGEHLFSYCTTKLSWLTRRAPFGQAVLSDLALSVDFAEHTTPNDVVTVVATEALTDNETWHSYAPGEWRLFRYGEALAEGRVEASAQAA